MERKQFCYKVKLNRQWHNVLDLSLYSLCDMGLAQWPIVTRGQPLLPMVTHTKHTVWSSSKTATDCCKQLETQLYKVLSCIPNKSFSCACNQCKILHIKYICTTWYSSGFWIIAITIEYLYNYDVCIWIKAMSVSDIHSSMEQNI